MEKEMGLKRLCHPLPLLGGERTHEEIFTCHTVHLLVNITRREMRGERCQIPSPGSNPVINSVPV